MRQGRGVHYEGMDEIFNLFLSISREIKAIVTIVSRQFPFLSILWNKKFIMDRIHRIHIFNISSIESPSPIENYLDVYNNLKLKGIYWTVLSRRALLQPRYVYIQEKLRKIFQFPWPWVKPLEKEWPLIGSVLTS